MGLLGELTPWGSEDEGEGVFKHLAQARLQE